MWSLDVKTNHKLYRLYAYILLPRKMDQSITYQEDEQTTNPIVSGTRNERVYSYVSKNKI